MFVIPLLAIWTSLVVVPSQACNDPNYVALQSMFQNVTTSNLSQWFARCENPCDHSWEGVSCDASGNITSINVEDQSLQGTFAFNLPSKLVDLNVKNNSLTGSLDFSKLPDTLQNLLIFDNKFHGTLNFSQLPRSIRLLRISKNSFTCEKVDMSDLPVSIVDFVIEKNMLTGPLILPKFPGNYPNFTRLLVGNQALNGSFNTSQAPRALRDIHVDATRFTGTFDWAGLPRTLTELRMWKNSFRGSLKPKDLPRTLKHLQIAQNWLSGFVNFTEFPKSLITVGIHRNSFSGSVDVGALPRNLTSLFFDRNEFSGTIDYSAFPPNIKVIRPGDNSFTVA